MPAAMPAPPLQVIAPARAARRARGRPRAALGVVERQRGLELAQEPARGRRPMSPGARPSVAAVACSSGGRSSTSTATLMPDARAPPSPPAGGPRRGCPRPCGRPSSTSLGHLIARAVAADARDGDAGGERQQIRRVAQHDATSAARCPAGADQLRPWRPRPADCSRGRDERAVRRARLRRARARGRSSSSVARRCRWGVPSALTRRGPGAPRRRARARAARRPSRGSPRARASGRRPRRRAARPRGRRRTSSRRRSALPFTVIGWPSFSPNAASSSCSTSSMTLPKRSTRTACATSSSPSARGERHLERDELVRVASARRRPRGALPAARAAATGAKMSRPWNVAEAGSRRWRERPMSTASTAPPNRATASDSRPLSGPTRMRSSSAVRSGDREPLAADVGIHDREVHAGRAVRQRAAQDQRAGRARRAAGRRGSGR